MNFQIDERDRMWLRQTYPNFGARLVEILKARANDLTRSLARIDDETALRRQQGRVQEVEGLVDEIERIVRDTKSAP